MSHYLIYPSSLGLVTCTRDRSTLYSTLLLLINDTCKNRNSRNTECIHSK